MKTNSSIFSLTLIALCGFAASSTLAGDQEDIQGTWTLQKVSMNGQDMPVPVVTYIFAGDTLTIHPEAGVEKKTTFKLETSKSKVMILQHNESGAETKPARSPYELSGDTLKIAFGALKDLSGEISDKGQILFTLQRKKS
jgi:uncharacterized protein (TIGR03067 family)